MSDGIYHIDSFILEAPKSAIFVGLQNDFMCDFSYSSDGQMAPNLGHETRDEEAAVGGDSDFDSQMDSPKQTCDCDFELDVNDGEQMEEDDEEELEEEQEQDHHVEDKEYDDGIGFSCDSDSGLTLPEDDDEFVLVTGQCLPSNSSHSCSSSMQCSSGSSGREVATSSSNSMELDMVLTPPPPPTLGKPKSGVHPLKFLHKII